MARFRKGDEVVSIKDIGGIAREFVPKGSRGVVTQAGWGSETKVLFTVTGGLLSAHKRTEIRVNDDEIG